MLFIWRTEESNERIMTFEMANLCVNIPTYFNSVMKGTVQ